MTRQGIQKNQDKNFWGPKPKNLKNIQTYRKNESRKKRKRKGYPPTPPSVG